jgi:gentisate 1,2-dioxygenase
VSQADEATARAAWRAAHVSPLWESPTAHKPDVGPAPPAHWPWQTLESLALGAAAVNSPAAVERRVLSHTNPQPPWTWHEHEHRGATPLVWLDVLDVPLHNALGTASFQPGPIPAQTPAEDAAVFHYPWASIARTLGATPRGPDGSRRVRYEDPRKAGPAMALLDAWVTEIDDGAETIPFRTSSNAVMSVVEGRGLSRIGDHSVSWGPRDVFTVPAGNWVTHRGESAPCRLLVVSDREIFRRLDLLTEEWG